MEELPSPVVLHILSRLPDPSDLAWCRLTSTSLRALTYQVPSLSFLCESADGRRGSFKPRVAGALSGILSLRSLSLTVRVDRAAEEEEDDVDDADDLHLTATRFLATWVPAAGGRGLGSLAISDYWVQSCWRKSDALSLISLHCGNLQDLMVKNAWLSVDGLRPMLKLTTLTLEFIRLDDENLDKVNECFPSLEVLNLIGVGGLKEPKIHLPRLKVCQWTVSNFPLSLTIHAPNLIKLQLKCVEPKTLVLETPLLSTLDLKTKKLGGIVNEGGLHNLKSVRLESPYLRSLVELFVSNESVNSLELEVTEGIELEDILETVTNMDLVSAFPNMENLKLESRAWLNLGRSFILRGIGREPNWRNLKQLKVHLPPSEFEITYVSSVLNLCAPFCKVILLIHGDASFATRRNIISRCTSSFPEVLWKWGVWKEAHER
ncbi:F-box/LRR-repeat protein [Iris pallida]|uniref:F-box/LRR-repeat protein n=1 Tax=Iris pallida TaxID=29817 RepID=A0AAX6ELQ7_IRIPA|nr:F-box/LRR-repeat protein [Iris pallida]